MPSTRMDASTTEIVELSATTDAAMSGTDEPDITVLPSSSTMQQQQQQQQQPPLATEASDEDEQSFCRVQAAVAGTGETTAVTEAYIQSILTTTVLGQGFFGMVYKGFDPRIACAFAVKSINTDILVGGNIVEIQRAKQTFQQEQQVRYLFNMPTSYSFSSLSYTLSQFL
jgi:hypothetical protein